MSYPSDLTSQPSRRDIVSGAALLAGAGIASAGLQGRAAATTRMQSASPAKPWFEISLAQWSLHLALGRGKEKTLENLEFPGYAAGLGIDAVEYVNSFFKAHAGDFGYLRELEAACRAARVQSLLIMVDGEGSLADEDPARRRAAIENHFRWISAAAFLGCHCIRVNAHGGDTAEPRAERAADSLRRLGEMGEHFGIDVVVENHGGLSSNGAWLAGVMRKAAHSRVGTLPDFGNFDLGDGEHYDRYKGVEELMPFAKAVSAKSHEFNDAGDEIHTDYRRMLGIVKAAGYRGRIGIEYEGSKHSEREGIVLTKQLLERVRTELA